MNNGKICISVCAETADEMISKIKRAESQADVIEVRFDCLRSDEIANGLPAFDSKRPTVLTFRPQNQGGKAGNDLNARLSAWMSWMTDRVIDDGTTLLDFEIDLVDTAHGFLSSSIKSFHDCSASPSELAKFYLDNFKGEEIGKIAVYAGDMIDAVTVWKLLDIAADANKLIIPIAMGEAGKWTRILGLAHGAYMTYASLDEGEETADGQITAKDLIEVYRVKELDKNTGVYGVIGDPVSSSLSPYMHNAAFAADGLNAVFLPLLVKDPDEFIRRTVATETREVELNFAGFSVTMPHKQTIMKHLDEIDAVAKKIGAVNTVKIVDDKLIGYNTDAHGFITPLKTKFGDLKNKRVAVFGAGGAARACVYALTQEGADVTVFARDLQNAEVFKNEFQVKLKQLPTDNGQLPTEADIVVNATPLGMKGVLENESPLTTEQLKGVKFVYDLVTRADDTPLLREAQKAGISAIGGLEMLIAQGMQQFKIWTGGEAPAELMRRSVTERLAK